MLVLERVSIHYGRVAAVRDLSLSVAQGEIVGLIGPNGAGKSSTLAAIMGLVKPSAGTIRYEGREINGQPPERVVRQGMALVPEGRHIFGTLSVAENLMLGTTPLRDQSGAGADLEGVLARFPVLRTYYRSSAAKLSGGEQQQLAIARALLSRPRLLLLDEPSLGLAPQVIDLVFDAMDELREDGVTILLVEQNAARTVEFADRTYVLRSGSLALAGTRDELLGKADFAEAYLGV